MTRFNRLTALPVAVLLLVVGASLVPDPAAAPPEPSPGAAAPSASGAPASASNAGFERIRALVGEWKGKAGDMAVEQSFKMISGGTAVMEELRFPADPAHNMVSVYHMAGDSLMLTHYCAENNQPRMKSPGYSGAPGAAGTMKFEFVDVTNLAAPDAMHMSRVNYEFRDADHFTSTWTARAGEKDDHSMPFVMERVN